MEEEMFSAQDNIEDLKKIFLEADTDFSGLLDVGELYTALTKMGADVTEDDIVQLMSEIDYDRNGQLDINEFVMLMSHGENISF